MTDDGTITTGAASDRIPPVYAALVDDAVEALSAELGDALHSIYLYGSVATGQARPPGSDLDLIVVLEHLMPEVVGAAAAELSSPSPPTRTRGGDRHRRCRDAEPS